MSPTTDPPAASTAARASATDGTANAMCRKPGRLAADADSSGIAANW